MDVLAGFLIAMILGLLIFFPLGSLAAWRVWYTWGRARKSNRWFNPLYSGFLLWSLIPKSAMQKNGWVVEDPTIGQGMYPFFFPTFKAAQEGKSPGRET